MRGRDNDHLVMVLDIRQMSESGEEVPPGLKSGDLYCMICKSYLSMPHPCWIEMSLVISKQFRKEHLGCGKGKNKEVVRRDWISRPEGHSKSAETD